MKLVINLDTKSFFMINVELEENDNKGRAFVKEAGEVLAEMTFSKVGSTQLIIDHTAVSEKLKGQGVGRKMLDKIVEMVRERGLKVIPLCPFAKSVFDKDESIRDVLRN